MQQHYASRSVVPLALPDFFSKIPIGGYQQVHPGEIIYCRGDRNYTYVYLTNGRRVHVSLTLSVLEERLAAGDFLRISRGRLVNKHSIRHYDGLTVTLANGTTIEVARRRRSEVRVALRLFSERFHLGKKRCA